MSRGPPASSPRVVGNWITDENLRLFMEALAHFAGASFDDDDWVGLEHDLILRRDPPGRERWRERQHRPMGEPGYRDEW